MIIRRKRITYNNSNNNDDNNGVIIMDAAGAVFGATKKGGYKTYGFDFLCANVPSCLGQWSATN